MAKYGEGDKRWIVEERADGTNVHNWHWAERDCLEWSRARLSSLLAGLTVLDGEGGLTIRTTTLDKLDGEAYVNIRKGKVIPGYELSLTLSWEAEAASESGVVNVAGAAEVPYLADENADEDPDLRVTVRGDETPLARRAKDAFLARGKPLVLEKIREFVAAMAKGGPAREELESKKTPTKAAPAPGAAAPVAKEERVHGEASRQPAVWRSIDVVAKERLAEVVYEKAVGEGIAKITINRPDKRNAFTPRTVQEMSRCFSDARDDPTIGAIILTGAGTEAFCSGGDQSVRGKGGYVGEDSVPRLNVLDLQVQIRRLPKPVIAMVAGYAVGGGHILHMVCDLTIAADNAVFGQTGPKVGSFDAGYGSTHMAAIIGQKKAREMWFLARMYTAQQALEMGLVNTVVPLAQLEEETLVWCREILRNSPTALRVLKSAMNAAEDGQAGIQELGGHATMLFYQSEEGNEGRQAYVEKRPPNFSKFPRLP